MASSKHMYFDKTEIIVTFKVGKNYKTVNLSYDKIQKIIFARTVIKKFPFKTEEVEAIFLRTATGDGIIPVCCDKVEAPYFEEYKAELEKFGKLNRITVEKSDEVIKLEKKTD